MLASSEEEIMSDVRRKVRHRPVWSSSTETGGSSLIVVWSSLVVVRRESASEAWCSMPERCTRSKSNSDRRKSPSPIGPGDHLRLRDSRSSSTNCVLFGSWNVFSLSMVLTSILNEQWQDILVVWCRRLVLLLSVIALNIQPVWLFHRFALVKVHMLPGCCRYQYLVCTIR